MSDGWFDTSISTLAQDLFSLENLYRAYRRCRRRKRNTRNALRFEQNLEEHLVSLHEELTAGTYRPGRTIAFLVEKPKRREIFAADFRDRVVHHVLVGYLEPRWERRFIHDSYACRKGKGTHKGMERLRTFTRKVTANGARRAWYLQLDVRGFFNSIDRDLLYARLAAREDDPAVLWLIRALVFYEPTAQCSLRRARPADFEQLPAHKTLFKAAPGCGLPIGNLTSQFFANVYLDALDQFVKHHLKARYYVRYCDDIVLLSTERAELERWAAEIEAFLADVLHLTLNARRRLRPVADGIDFLGYIVRPDYVLVRRRVVRACYARLARAEKALAQQGLRMGEESRPVYPWPWPVLDEVYRVLNAYLGHFRHAHSRRLIQQLWARFPWLAEYYRWDGARLTWAFRRHRPALRLDQQQAQFSSGLPSHILVAQLGNWCELWGGHPACPLTEAERRFHRNRLPALRRRLWASGAPVAWIAETGRRITTINERALVRRWPGAADPRPLSLHTAVLDKECF